MAKITYKPGPGGPSEVTWGGQTLQANKSVTIDNPAVIAKAQNNPYFEVSASKQETRQAEIVGGFADANTGEEVELVRKPRQFGYGLSGGGDTGPTPPSAATQGSSATLAATPRMSTDSSQFEEVYGAPQAEFASGEYDDAPEYIGPEGTEGAAAKKATKGKK